MCSATGIHPLVPPLPDAGMDVDPTAPMPWIGQSSRGVSDEAISSIDSGSRERQPYFDLEGFRYTYPLMSRFVDKTPYRPKFSEQIKVVTSSTATLHRVLSR